jgi:hypothetical protein
LFFLFFCLDAKEPKNQGWRDAPPPSHACAQESLGLLSILIAKEVFANSSEKIK